MTHHFKAGDSLKDFQELVGNIYGFIDDRGYSVWDLCSNLERYSLRALKGIRKGDMERTKLNLMIAFSWAVSLGNRLRIDVEKDVWNRFPYQCSYCAHVPCICKQTKPTERPTLVIDEAKHPKTLEDMQRMFDEIYPHTGRTLMDAGVHLAEEVGEISEAIHIFLGEHKPEQVDQIRLELADYMSCVFGVANSIPFSTTDRLAKMYASGCPICKSEICTCTFSVVAGHAS